MEELQIGQVPGLSIVGMVVAGLVSILLPIVLAIIIRKKTKAWIPSLFIGAGVMIVFALILESIVHRIVLRVTGDTITGNLLLYALYGGLAAGVFEEIGRFIAMKTLMKKHLRKENALMYGVGHGGAEAILLVGVTMVSNLIVAAMINSGSIYSMFATMSDAEKELGLSQISALWTTPSGDFFLSAIERTLAIALQICLSYLVYRAARGKKPILLITAILLHALFDGFVVIVSKLYNTYIAEAVFGVMVAVFVALTIILYRKESDTDY